MGGYVAQAVLRGGGNHVEKRGGYAGTNSTNTHAGVVERPKVEQLHCARARRGPVGVSLARDNRPVLAMQFTRDGHPGKVKADAIAKIAFLRARRPGRET